MPARDWQPHRVPPVTLSLYLSRIIGLRIATAWAVLTLLGISIDLFQSAPDLLESGSVWRLLSYVGLRTPQIMVTLFPVAVLVGATTAFLSLSHHSEVVIMRAAGYGIFVILRQLMPLGLVLGALYSQVGDRVNSWTTANIAIAFPETKGEAPIGSLFWARDGLDIIRARLGNKEGSLLADVTVFMTDENGHIGAKLNAKSARFEGSQWFLSGVTETASNRVAEKQDRIWQTNLLPHSVREIASKSIDVSADEAKAALSGTAVSTRSNSYYETRIARSYSAIALPAVMFLLAALAGFGSTRGNMAVRHASFALVLGFVYIAVDGMFGSLGEVGIIGPSLAAFAPTVFFAAAGIWGLILLDE